MARKKKSEQIDEIQNQEIQQAETATQDETKYAEYIVSPTNKNNLVNARAAAGIDAAIVAKLKDGQIVKSATKPGKGWIEIDLDGKKAFVMSTKLKKK